MSIFFLYQEGITVALDIDIDIEDLNPPTLAKHKSQNHVLDTCPSGKRVILEHYDLANE